MDAAKQAVDSVTEGVKKVAIGGGKKEKKAKGGGAGDAAKGPIEMKPPPAFLQHRVEMFERLKKKYEEEIAKKPREPISITMPDGTIREGISWETSPADVAKGISNSLYKRTVIARIDGDPNKLWDLERPLEASCKLELLPFDDEQGQQVFWHSSAHVLGEACERRWGCSLCIGPPIESGFYYEMALPDGGAIQESDWKPLETIVGSIVKEKQKFERLELSKEDLLEMFNYNKYKQHIIKDKIPDGTYTTVYRNGPLIDLCRGPHVPDTGRIESFSIMKNSASYFLGSQENDTLQRLYGVSFPDKKRMAEHKKFLEEAAKRDHRRIGTDQELFFFHPLSPGSAFWMPHGGVIYDNIMAYIREQYRRRRYRVVHTPNMYNADLWRQSGHWDYYQDDMFVIDVDKVKFGLKPMNCPGHCLMFAHRERTYKELPLRLADFGVLHRNEASGALSGLTRVRRFQQDDAHIFCREDQIKGEMDDLFNFLAEMYGMLGFTFRLKLSTRPEKYLGDLETWNRAEKMLKESLDQLTATTGVAWELNEGDGAFYGPKIDVKVLDSLKREWQVATFQLDFMNPRNFNLEYMVGDAPVKGKDKDKEEEQAPDALQPPKLKSKDPQAVIDSAAGKTLSEHEQNEAKRARFLRPLSPGCARPVIIHRAMAGSIERFTGILCEHFGGKWPYWLSPRQIMVIPVGKGYNDYAIELETILYDAGMHVEIDLSGNTLQKKVRSAQLAQFNFIFIVGDEEVKGRMVNVRYRDDTSAQDRGKPVSLDEVVEKLKKLRDDRGMYNPFAGVVAKEEKRK